MTSPLVRPLSVLALLAAPATAQDSDWYLEFAAGASVTDEADAILNSLDYDAGYSIDFLIGKRVHEGDTFDFALEAEFYFNEQGVDDGLIGAGSSTVEQMSNGGFLVGGSMTWPLNEKISLYGGAAIGLATALDLDSKSDALSDFDIDDEQALAYQGKIGARYALGETSSWFFQYRQLFVPDIDVEDTFLGQEFEMDIEQSLFEVGVRWDL